MQSVESVHQNQLNWDVKATALYTEQVTEPLNNLHQAMTLGLMKTKAPATKAELSSFDHMLNKEKLRPIEITVEEANEPENEQKSPTIQFNQNPDKEMIPEKQVQEYSTYVRQYNDPFSMYEDTSTAERKQQEYATKMRDSLIHVNDAWGMKRLQAHAGNTLVLLKGPHKGLPRDLPLSSVSTSLSSMS